jgi:hypothetical protein
VLQQLTSLQDQLRRSGRGAGAQSEPAPSPQVLTEIDTTIKTLRHFRDSVLARPLPGLGYRQYPRLLEEVQSVSGMLTRAMMPPTAGETLRMGELNVETTQAQTRLDGIIQVHVGKINQLLAGTPHVITPGGQRVIVP